MNENESVEMPDEVKSSTDNVMLMNNVRLIKV